MGGNLEQRFLMMKGKFCMNEWELVVKAFGVILILGGCLFYGITLNNEWEKNYEEYESLRQVLLILARNQAYIKEPITIILKDSFRENESFVGEESVRFAESLLEIPFLKAWDSYIYHMQAEIGFDEKLKNQLLRLGIALQGIDAEGMQLQIRACLEVLDEVLVKKRGELEGKKKIGMSCCMMVGLFTVIIFI